MTERVSERVRKKERKGKKEDEKEQEKRGNLNKYNKEKRNKDQVYWEWTKKDVERKKITTPWN